MRCLTAKAPNETHHAPASALSLHRHEAGYFAVVLDGGYEEYSPDGRFTFGVGTLVAHPPFHLHGNLFHEEGAHVLNLPWPDDLTAKLEYRAVRLDKIEPIVRRARGDGATAAMVASEAFFCKSHMSVLCGPAPRWLEQIAKALKEDASAGVVELIRAHARRVGVSSEHAARRFRYFFGVTPSGFRREYRIRRAIAMISGGLTPASVAAQCGFADQSHMTRVIKKAMGRTPKHFSHNKSPRHQFCSIH